MRQVAATLALGLLALLVATSAQAAPINYGDFAGLEVMYLDVTETANAPVGGEPLFGPPSVIGNVLDFDPKGFTASASMGTTDLVDGQLNLTLMANQGSVLSSVAFSERGDYTLAGAGTAATQVQFGLSIAAVTVLEVDGVALASPVALDGASVSGTKDLSSDSGILVPWALGLQYDVNAALNAAGVDFRNGATKLEFVIDDSLVALSESATIAYLAKKDFSIGVTTGTGTPPGSVPEPAAALLIGGAWALLAAARRRAS